MSLDIALYVDARPDIAAIAVAAEAAGFTHLWVYDSPLVFSDTTVALTRALDATDHIAVGPGVANPLQRPAPHTAQLAATLAKIAPGRVVIGLGIGNSARRSLGMRPATIVELVGHARVVRDMTRGGSSTYREGDASADVRFIHPQGRWIDVDHPAPIWLSAFGPRTRAAATEVADGVLVRWEGPAAARSVRAEIDTAARQHGRDGGEIQLGVVHAVLPIDHDQELETDEIRQAVGPLVVSRLRYLTANVSDAAQVAGPFRDAFLAYRRYRDGLAPEERHLENYHGYLVFTPEELEHFVTPETIRAVVRVASPTEVAAELDDIADAGIDHVSLQMAGDVVAFCRRIGDRVIGEVTHSMTRREAGRSQHE